MSTSFDSFSFSDFFSGYALPLLSVVGSAVLILLLFKIWQFFKHPSGEWLIREAIRGMGARYGKNLRVHNGVDGFFVIDYVVLSDEGICLILLKRFEGSIYGGEKIEQWTQVIRGGSYGFQNPLHQLQLVTATVKSLLPKVPIKGVVLFAGDCQFPKDKPEGVFLLSELPKGPKKQKVRESYTRAWEHLIANANLT